MGCQHSKDAALVHRTSSVAIPLRPSTPSFHVQNTKIWAPPTSTSATKEELPSFVVSDSAGLVGSSDNEPVHGLVSAFTFSFIQTSESSSTSSSIGDHLFTSVEQTSPRLIGSPECLAFAMTGDMIELMAISEERRGLKDSADALISAAQEESVVLSSSSKGVTEGGQPLPTSLTHVGKSSAMTALAITQSNESLIHDLNAINHRRVDNSHNTIETRRSMNLSELSDECDYMVSATSATGACHKPSVDRVRETSYDESGNDSIERQSIEDFAAATVQEIVVAALSNIAEAPRNDDRWQLRDCKALVTGNSLQIETSSTTITNLSRKVQPSSDPAQLRSFRIPMYTIVDTSTENGVVMYHVQLMDEATDSAKWQVPLLCRYSEFRKMYSKLKEIKVSAVDELPELPKLPRAGVVSFAQGRQNKKLIQERQEQFSCMLRYIAAHRELHDSAVFQSFLAK